MAPTEGRRLASWPGTEVAGRPPSCDHGHMPDDDNDPNIIQRVVGAVLGDGVEAESRRWVFTCECGEQWSIWDAGGIRHKAAGRPTKLSRCPACGTTAMRTLQKLPDR